MKFIDKKEDSCEMCHDYAVTTFDCISLIKACCKSLRCKNNNCEVMNMYCDGLFYREEEQLRCSKCNKEMGYLGNVSKFIYASNPPQWDVVYACHDCKVKMTVRVHGESEKPVADISGYEEIKEVK